MRNVSSKKTKDGKGSKIKRFGEKYVASQGCAREAITLIILGFVEVKKLGEKERKKCYFIII